jgi:CHRD domain
MKNDFLRSSRSFGLALLLGGAILATSCKEDEIESSTEVPISGTAQVPSVTTQASGRVTATYNRDTRILTFQLNWQNLTGASSDPNILNLREVTLAGTNEVPAINSPATGRLTGNYNLQTNVLSFTVTWGGISGGLPPSAMHFHGPARATENAGVIVNITGFPQQNTTAAPFTSTATLTDAQEVDLLGGRWYYNLHSATFPSGELRGQLLFQGVPTMMHFHGPAGTTENAGVQYDIVGFPVRSTGNHTGATQPLTPEQESDLLSGRWYYNLHTTAFPGGELRGQLFAQ